MSKSVSPEVLEQIADALKTHLGIDLGDVSRCDDVDKFVDLVKVAAKNTGSLKKRLKGKQPKLAMSLTGGPNSIYIDPEPQGFMTTEERYSSQPRQTLAEKRATDKTTADFLRLARIGECSE